MPLRVVKIRSFTGHAQAVYALAGDESRGLIYSAGADGMIVRWETGEEDGVLFARENTAVYALCAEGDLILSGTRDGRVTVMDRNGTLIRQIKLAESPVYRIIPSSGQFILLRGDGILTCLQPETGALIHVKLSDLPLRAAALCGDELAVSGTDGMVHMLDASLQVRRSFRISDATVFSLAFDPVAKSLISGGRDARMRIHINDRQTGELPAHLLHVHDLDYNARNGLLLSSSMDKTIKIWDTATLRLLKVIDADRYDAHRSSVNKILWFGKNKFISCSDDRTLMCFELQED